MAAYTSLPNASEWEQRKGEDDDAFYDRIEQMFDQLRADTANLPDGSIAGALVEYEDDDGKAYLVVVNESPLTVAHVPYNDLSISALSVPDDAVDALTAEMVLEQVRVSKRLWGNQ